MRRFYADELDVFAPQIGPAALEILSLPTCAPLCALISQVDRLPAEVIPPALALLRAVAAASGGIAQLQQHAAAALPTLAQIVIRDSAQNELRASAMHTLAAIVHDASAEDAAACAALLEPLAAALAAALAPLAALPFADVKHAAYHLLESLAGRQWGLAAMVAAAGLLDQLLDGEAAAREDREDSQWRYSVLRAVLACEGAQEVVGDRTQYVAQLVERGDAQGSGGGGRQPNPAPQVMVEQRGAQ